MYLETLTRTIRGDQDHHTTIRGDHMPGQLTDHRAEEGVPSPPRVGPSGVVIVGLVVVALAEDLVLTR